jgi:hypothetical protein
VDGSLVIARVSDVGMGTRQRHGLWSVDMVSEAVVR